MAKINIITLGESGVGKTSIVTRFITGKFKEYGGGTFVDNFKKTITVENREIEVIVWDTAGQERYNSLIRRYFAMADGVLLVYDVNESVTFSKLSSWLKSLKSENETAEILLVGNKMDCSDAKRVNTVDVERFSERENLEHVEVSAKSGQNVDAIFLSLTAKILEHKGILPRSSVSLQNSEDNCSIKGSQQSIEKEKEAEISFTYYGKSATPEKNKLEERNIVFVEDSAKLSKNSNECAC